MSANFFKALPWGRLIKVGKPFWVSEKKWVGLGHLALVLTLMFANSYINVYIGATTGAFMDALSRHSMPEFWTNLAIWVGAIAVAIPVQTFYAFFRTRLALIWRSWLSTRLFAGYFSNFAYYKLLSHKDVDNPDQRMTQDVDSFCNTSVGLFMSLLDAFVNIFMFTIVLWKLMPALPIEIWGYTAATSIVMLWLCKAILPLAVIAYAIFGSVVVLWIGRALPQLNFNQSMSEADLRFGLSEARREAETVAFNRAEDIAESQAKQGITRVIDTLFSIMKLYRNMSFFTTPYNMLMPLIPTSIMGWLYLQGYVPFGTVAQATIAFSAVFGGATILIGQFGGIMAYRTTIDRVGAIMEALDGYGRERCQGSCIDVSEGEYLKLDKLTVAAPDGSRDLVKELTLDLKPGCSVLVTGEQGIGKTALLRAMAGFWDRGSGKLQRPPFKKMMFLTQKPYLPPMTLRQALSYSYTDSITDDDRLKQVLQLCKLEDLPGLVGGLDTIQTWSELLTPSELQRLSVARVMLRKPEVIVIDEGTNALEEETVLLFYTLLLSLGATIVTAGTLQLAKYHRHVLEIKPDGSWTYSKASDLKENEARKPLLQKLSTLLSRNDSNQD